MLQGNVRWHTAEQEWEIRGQRVKKLVGRSAFDWAINLSYHFTGQGDFPGTGLGNSRRWIEHNQRLFDRQDVVLRVFNEAGDWSPCPGDPPSCMFGQEPRDQRLNNAGNLVGIWNVGQLQNLARRQQRVKSEHVTRLNELVIEEAFKASHETGCIFEWVIDATLKHTDGLTTGTTDHVIRQTARLMRAMQERYPNAAFIVNARNEWDAKSNTTLKQCNDWAQRMYRWKNPVNGDTVISFTSPGSSYEAEQWPECFFIVDHGGRNDFDYDCGPEPGKFQGADVHEDRRRGKGDLWIQSVTPAELAKLESLRRGMPLMNTENMYFVSMPGTERWYRGPDGWNNDIAKQLRFMENSVPLWHYYILHDDIGKKANADWNTTAKGQRWEGAIAEFFDGAVVPPPGPVKRFRYEPVIGLAYNELLDRAPDPSGLEGYDLALSAGLTEAQMRENLIRSSEYKDKNPA